MKITKISLLFIIILTGCSTRQDGEEQEKTQHPNQNDTTQSKKASQPETNKPPILGLDVSHFQGNIDWNQIEKDGISYAYAKATEGVTLIDQDFKLNIGGASAAGIPIGGYHFYMSDDNPEKQANHFVSTLNSTTGWSMPPVLDVEPGSMKGPVNNAAFQKDVLIWLNTVETSLGVKPIIYTNHRFGNEYLTDPKFSNYHLWIAEYTSKKVPLIPEVWKDKGWLMWQRSEKGTYKGAPGDDVDLDILNGTAEDLKQLVYAGK